MSFAPFLTWSNSYTPAAVYAGYPLYCHRVQEDKFHAFVADSHRSEGGHM